MPETLKVVSSTTTADASFCVRYAYTPAPVPDPVMVTPQAPTVTQATLESGPSIVLATTAGITYSIVGAVVAGGTVNVIATPNEGYVLGAADGWTSAGDGTASYQVVLDQAPVPDPVMVTPQAPTVTQATLESGPSIVLATTAGITYSIVGAVVAGGTVNVIATPNEGYVLGGLDGTGWTSAGDGTAIYQVVLDKAPETPVTPPAPSNPIVKAITALVSAVMVILKRIFGRYF